MQKRNIVLALTSLALAAASFAASAADQVFSNTSTITIHDNTSATPYPSTISVSGLNGNIDNVSVTLNGLSHTWPGDLNVILVAPGGQKIALMQRIGGGTNGCSNDFSSATLIFDANAASGLSGCGYPAAGGTFLPTIGTVTGISSSPSPAPAGPYSNDLTTLDGAATAQNGNWSLYVSDHFGADAGSISGGWTLTLSGETLTGAPPTTCASEGYTGIKLDWCRNVCEKGYTGATLNAWIRRWWDKYHTYPYCAQ